MRNDELCWGLVNTRDGAVGVTGAFYDEEARNDEQAPDIDIADRSRGDAYNLGNRSWAD